MQCSVPASSSTILTQNLNCCQQAIGFHYILCLAAQRKGMVISMKENICRFLPKNGEANDINILNFVYETKEQDYSGFRCETSYKIHLVTKGSGKLRLFDTVYDLNDGDVFFIFPSMSYVIESGDDFEYMYISYIGLRAVMLMDKININKKNFLFKNLKDLKHVWKESIIDNKSILNLRCEGILLYSFSVVGEIVINAENQNEDMILQIKKYIDENFTDSELSLEKISGECRYNKKYISTAYKKKFGIGISQYITELRIQYACVLAEQGFTSVKEIAFLCGFAEPLYFSKVFKNKIGISPKEYISKKKITLGR